jgi:hypothetical protein
MGSDTRRTKGLILAVGGIAANNLAFLSDLVFQNQGYIIMGAKSWGLAAVGLVVALIGIRMLLQAPPESDG